MFNNPKKGLLITFDSGGTIFSKMCSATNEEYSVRVSSRAYLHYELGGPCIQEAFPELDEDQREFLISGFTPGEWDALFSSSDGEEEEDG